MKKILLGNFTAFLFGIGFFLTCIGIARWKEISGKAELIMGVVSVTCFIAFARLLKKYFIYPPVKYQRYLRQTFALSWFVGCVLSVLIFQFLAHHV